MPKRKAVHNTACTLIFGYPCRIVMNVGLTPKEEWQSGLMHLS